MSNTTLPLVPRALSRSVLVRPAAVPFTQIWPWLLFVPVLLLAIYFVGAEEGATSLIKGMYVHEFVHDARHLLGFPCH